MERKIVLNRIQTPDGTILTNRYRWDYQQYVDANGKTYMVDGGLDYLRRSGNDYTELSVFSDAPFEVIRQSFHRLNKGKDGTEVGKWVALCDMDDEWLDNVIVWNKERGIDKGFYGQLYEQEFYYRDACKISDGKCNNFEILRDKFIIGTKSKGLCTEEPLYLSEIDDDLLKVAILHKNMEETLLPLQPIEIPKPEFEVTKTKIIHTHNDLEVEEMEDGFGKYKQIKGVVYTQYGVVSVCGLEYTNRKVTAMDMVVDGFLYYTEIKKFYSAKYLGTLANRFAKQIHNTIG